MPITKRSLFCYFGDMFSSLLRSLTRVIVSAIVAVAPALAPILTPPSDPPPQPPVISTVQLEDAAVGVAYEAILAVEDDRAGSWSTQDSLPDGLELDSVGVIAGTPQAAGATTFTVTFTDGDNLSDSATLSLRVEATTPVITTTSLPNGVVGEAYEATLAVEDDRAGVWAVTGGTMPAGLTLSDDVISGVPTAAGDADFEVSFTDDYGQTAIAEFTITVAAGTPEFCREPVVTIPESECAALLDIQTANPDAYVVATWGQGDPCGWDHVDCDPAGEHVLSLELMSGDGDGLSDPDDGFEMEPSVSAKLTVLPASIKNLTELQVLILTNNELTTLPDSIGQLSKLVWLGVGHNRLGELPETIGGLTNLTQVDFSGNRLVTLPNSIGELTNLGLLMANDNALAALPESFWDLTSLEMMILANNELTELPESIGNLTKVEWFDLSYNKLETLPASVAGMKSLYVVSLSYNNLNSDISEWAGPMSTVGDLWALFLEGNGCLHVGGDAELEQWLNRNSNNTWQDGCSSEAS